MCSLAQFSLYLLITDNYQFCWTKIVYSSKVLLSICYLDFYPLFRLFVLACTVF